MRWIGDNLSLDVGHPGFIDAHIPHAPQAKDLERVNQAHPSSFLGLGRLTESRNFIDHETRQSIQAIAFVRRNWNAKQRRFSWVSGHDADRDRFGGIEAVILQNDCRSRLAGVILRLGAATVHISPRFNQSPGCSETASIKSWSRRACGLCATTSD